VEFNRRSMASSDAFFVQNKIPNWTNWRVDNAVADGYKVNPWVYRAVKLIAQNAGSVPWVVMDAKMTPVWEHPITKLMKRPNEHFSGQQLVELVVMWLQLSGNAYLKEINVNGDISELWPISPDRISPIPSANPSKYIDGYKIIADGGAERIDPDYNRDNVMHIKLFDPSNPYLGISPLQAAAKSVDLDNAQLEWNTSTMQNRGVVDGVFTFKRSIDGQQAQSIVDRLIDKFSGKKNARKPLVIGDDATYTRLSLNAIELDFLNSRKHNREEILSVFGVPPQLIGIQDSSTYNNYSISMKIFWETTVLPLLDMLKDAFNHRFNLPDGMSLNYDTSEVAALRHNEEDKAKVAKIYYEIGVPVSMTNEKLALGLKQYEGWDKVNRVIMPAEAGAAQLKSIQDSESKNPSTDQNMDDVRKAVFGGLAEALAERDDFEVVIKQFQEANPESRAVGAICKVIQEQVTYGRAAAFDANRIRKAIIDTGIFRGVADY
jgi:HK97 family phage portal protein